MPTPQENETQEEFIERCIPIVIEEGTAEDSEQAAAVCYSMWREAKGETDKSKSARAATIKRTDDGGVVIGGYGVIWGGKDLDGQFFTKNTDFWFDKITDRPVVLYDHGMDGEIRSEMVGRVKSRRYDEVGLWLETQVNESNEYLSAITELIESGRLGYSSGAVSHLVEIDKWGEIKTWPIAEFSLTPTPCEPRTLGVAALRSLAGAEPAVKALMPEDAQASAENANEQASALARAKAIDMTIRSMEE